MSLFESLAEIEDVKAFTAALSDEEAVSLAQALIAEKNVGRWAETASTFPTLNGWPPDYRAISAWRADQRKALAADPYLVRGAKLYYRDHIAEFIDHWCITYDPRNASRGKSTRMPFILFQRQSEFVAFLLACLDAEEDGLVEKSRDMGATWVAGSFSIALWLFWPGAAVGWGSRKEDLVDKLGDPDSIFEKMRMIVRDLPPEFLPRGFSEPDHMTFMKFINPETGATVTGESGDNVGRGGRSLLYFKDESAHYARPELVEAALGDNTNVQIDMSSVNGLGNVFHRRREAGVDWVPGEPLEPGRTAIFVMDWRDHPEKTQDWYDRRRQKAIDNGLLHKFRQEVDRDYSASVEGTIIPAEWVRSAIDAHITLGIPEGGLWRGALDVADGGGDTNADAWFQGVVLREVDSWGARDTGETTRRFLDHASGKGEVEAEYDSIGVGSGVKAEANRLEEDGTMPPRVRLVPWNAAATPRDPDDRVIPGDMDSPTNREFFGNLKAQAWWRTRLKFERTHRAVQAALGKGPPFTWEADELISIDSRIPLLRQVEKELSQPTASRSTTMKLLVDKTPEGTRSPNLADAIVMADNPLPGLRHVYPVAPAEIAQEPFRKVPDHWPRGFGMKVEPGRVTVLWAAFDKESDILYLVSEHSRSHAEPSANAQAIKARGIWMPGFIETDKAGQDEIRQVIDVYRGLGLNVDYSERALEAGISDMHQRISTGRLKAFTTCTGFFQDYRSYRRDEDGDVIGSGLIDCARILCRPSSLARMIVKPAREMGVVTRAHVGDRRIGY